MSKTQNQVATNVVKENETRVGGRAQEGAGHPARVINRVSEGSSGETCMKSERKPFCAWEENVPERFEAWFHLPILMSTLLLYMVALPFKFIFKCILKIAFLL